MQSDSDEIEELDDEEEGDEHEDPPWKDQEDWAKGQIECSNKDSAIAGWILCVFMCGVAGYVFFSVPTWFDFSSVNWKNPDWENIDYLDLGLTVGIPLFILIFVIFAVRLTIRWKKFGKSTFFLSGETGVVGGSLSGVIKTENEFQPTRDYELRLTCVESITTGSGKGRKTKHHTRWENVQNIPVTKTRSGIPVAFNIPADCFESEDEKAVGWVEWKLEVSAPTPGVNYHAEFVVPVFRKREI